MVLLCTLYQIQSKSYHEEKMRDFLCEWIAKNCPESTVEQDKKGNLYVTKGTSDTYPVIVAHMDQVQEPTNMEAIVKDNLIFGYDLNEGWFAGLGADDKNGIWIALKCLLKYPAIKLTFFVEEEVGCGGSHDCVMSFFDNARFVIQCDRKGSHDFISKASGTALCTKEFIEDAHIKDFGYKTTDGLLTDVKTLRSRGLKVCSCNLSCGYYDPHTTREYTLVNDLLNCQKLVEYMIDNMTKVYEFPISSKTYTNWGTAGSNSLFSPSYEDTDYADNDFYECQNTPTNVKHIKVQKVTTEEYVAQLKLLTEKAKEAIKAGCVYPYNFYMDHKDKFPNVSYAIVSATFYRLKHELPG